MADQSIIARHASSVGSSSAVKIDFGTGVQKVYVQTFTQDVFIEFNGTANSDSFRIPSANTAQSEFDFKGSNVQTVSLLSVTGTANVYVIGYTGG